MSITPGDSKPTLKVLEGKIQCALARHGKNAIAVIEVPPRVHHDLLGLGLLHATLQTAQHQGECVEYQGVVLGSITVTLRVVPDPLGPDRSLDHEAPIRCLDANGNIID